MKQRPRPELPVLAFVTAALFAMTNAFAAAPADVTESNQGLRIGIAVGAQTRAYRDIDTETRVLPLVSYENSWVRIAGLGADLKLGSAGPVSFALGARYSMNGYKQDDAPILGGMAERKGGFWVGPSATWRNDFVDVSVEGLGDASGNSKGAQWRLTLDHTLDYGSLRVTPRVAAIWRDKKYNDYYYGVRAEEVRADRPFYQGTASTDAEFGFRANYSISKEHAVFLDISQTVYGKGVKNSPLVDETSSMGARFGYLYRF